MKKIGICIDSLEMGGAEKLLVDIIKMLYETKKYKIYLVTKNESNSDFYKEIKEKVEYSYLISKDTEKRNRRYGEIGKFFTSLEKRRSFKKFKNDVDLIIDFLDGDFYKFLKNVKDKKKIVWLHSGYKELQIKKKIDKKLNSYDQTIVITEAMYKEIKEKTDIKNVTMIYNLIDFGKIDRLLSENISNEDKELLKKDFILSVCRLDENQKDVGTLLRSFSNYKGKELLYIVGEGPSENQLKELTYSLGIDSKVVFLGKKMNPFVYMQNAKCFVLSTKNEGFGLVIAEALYCGTKVVASDCEYGPREILLDGKIGVLTSVGNEISLLNGIKKSLEKSCSRKDVMESLERFKKEQILSQIEGVLDV